MSESELYHMPDSNDSFDLPRWQTHVEQPSYLYSGPPPQQQRLPSIPARQQSRVSQLVEQDHQLAATLSPYNPQSQLARSASLGASAGGLAPRHRRTHPPDDLEGAFPAEPAGPRQPHGAGAYYPSTYQQNTQPASPADQYPDLYYTGSPSVPKRLQPGNDSSSTAAAASPTAAPRGGRSPMRVPNTPVSASPLDQYSPPYYQGHVRTHSQVKKESTPPSGSPYPGSAYSSPYPMDTSSPMAGHLGTNMPMKPSISTPSTPLSYMHPTQYYAQDSMAIDPPAKRRAPGFRRVRTAQDLAPKPDTQPTNRRMASDGTYLSPLRQLTTNIVETYHICNRAFRYESNLNPRRVLTKPSKPVHNDGYDNEDCDYILYVNDWLGSDDGQKYLILDILGQGTFGQVVKCQNMKTHEIVAVKVVKNKPAYFNQSMMEVTILELLNKNCDPNDEHHILRLRDSFIHRHHLCLVFELLSSNLYELIKQNQFQGLSTQLVKVFMAQLLDALTVLKEARLIHCDLKPENILLKSLQSPQIKVIDFGSACHERQTVYTYIQSRFYRSPEVLLGMSYTAAIDMWSLGCIAVELFLGLPLFPGTSEYNQLVRIIEMLGLPPLSMLNTGKQTSQFFDTYDVWSPVLNAHEKKYRIKSIEQYSREHNTNEQPGKQYFKATSLPEIISTAPMPPKTSRQPHELEKELNNRAAFIDFCQGLLNLNPVTRWTPQQARLHPFITGEKFTKPFVPDGLAPAVPAPSAGISDPRRPYGGLVASQPRGTRAYQDAAAYNQHLAQHQVYTAQAQQQQAASSLRNPYMTAPQQQSQPQTQPPPSYQSSADLSSGYQSQPPSSSQSSQSQQHPQYSTNAPGASSRTLSHTTSTGSAPPSQYTNQPTGAQSTLPTGAGHTSNPSGHATNPYVPNRSRATTINQMDNIPPALARLQHMNQDIIGGRNALTPVLNRDDAMREWERRQAGKAAAAQPYPQLEYLQQQAEIAAASGISSWGGHHRYPPPPSKLAHAYQPSSLMTEDDNGTSSRRDVVMSNVRNAAGRGDHGGTVYGSGNVIASPPQAYSGNPSAGARYQSSGYGGGQPPVTGFDQIERRTDIGNMYVPMQPDPYGGYSTARHGVPPPPAAQQMPPSFYGSSVVPSGQMTGAAQRNPFQMQDGSQATNPVKDVRRGNGGIEAWPR